jgi:hypothetical protein
LAVANSEKRPIVERKSVEKVSIRVKFIHYSVVFAMAIVTAQPLCCCVAKAADTPEPARSCCPVKDTPAPADETPCPDEPCEDCHNLSLTGLMVRDASDATPAPTGPVALAHRPPVLRCIQPAELIQSWQPARIQFRADLSPPLLCVFRT